MTTTSAHSRDSCGKAVGWGPPKTTFRRGFAAFNFRASSNDCEAVLVIAEMPTTSEDSRRCQSPASRRPGERLLYWGFIATVSAKPERLRIASNKGTPRAG
jgi:hypothetical protein